MKSVVINLKSRTDRLAAFGNNNKDKITGAQLFEAIDGSKLTYASLTEMGFDTDKEWRDPILRRVLTRGEIGCFLSHYKVWQMVAEGDEPVAIFEDDVTCFRPLSEVENLLGDHELMYLVHSEQKKDGVVVLNNDLVKPCFPYWLAAYILTPEAARKLVETDIHDNIIPCDEYVPRMLDRIDAVALRNPLCKQNGREEMGTNIEPRSEEDYFRDFETHVLTCGDDESRMEMLTESTRRLGIKVKNILTREWKGSDMKGPGGGQKLNELKNYMADLPDNDVVLFTDAFDVFYTRELNAIIGRYLGYKRDIVFSAELSLWPDPSLRFPPSHTKHRYLNSGTFIGRVGEIKRMLRWDIADSADDQLYLQKQYLTGNYNAVLDVEGYIFQTHDPAVVFQEGMIYNPVSRCYSCIYHGNGGDQAKELLKRLYIQAHPAIKYAHVHYEDFEVIGNEMLLIDFLTPSQCEEWIRLGDEIGTWHPDPHDRFPSHDIHMKKVPGLWEEVEFHWKKVIAPITDKYWSPSSHYALRKSFLMRYSMDTQKTLGLHNDSSQVTGSVKLNDNYEGATLIFPRQNVTNKDIPIGKMILFPGPLTHGHYVDELTSGVKYSATFWTSRYPGDLLDPDN